MQIFIRHATTKERHSSFFIERAFASIPRKEGFETVYKPFGLPEGQGFYYIDSTEETMSFEEVMATLKKPEAFCLRMESASGRKQK